MSKVIVQEADKKYSHFKNDSLYTEASYKGYITSRIKQSQYTYARFNDIVQGYARPDSYLPFRVSFQNVSISQYTGGQPIGIAIIGFNNYIL